MLVMLASISASVGDGWSLRNAATAMICPDWQYPHCGTSSAIHACCTGCLPSGDSPSMVVMLAPSTLAIGTEQDRIGWPLMWTVQAPHCAMPHPYFVPVRPTTSRIAHKRGVLGSTLKSRVFPLIVSRAIGVP